MTPEEIKNDDHDNDCISCWSCEMIVLIKELSSSDGFCPYCKQEIDLDEY